MSTDAQQGGLAVVTGASTGIGRALARQFAVNGFDLVIAADEPEIHEAARELAAYGREVVPVEVDLATPEGVETLHGQVTALDRPVDALALNAGMGVNGRFYENPLDKELKLVDLNVRSTVHLAHLVLQGMVRRGSGRVLVVASIAGKAPGPYHTTYAASKAFDHYFAEGIRHELADTGVSVTSLMPGPTETAFFDRADMRDTRIGAGPKDDADKVAKEAYEALMAGKDHVVTGSFLNSLQVSATGVVPDPIAAAFAAGMTKPGGAE